MCTNEVQIDGLDEFQFRKKPEEKHEDKFGHFYNEKYYHISKRNSQTLCTGYRPDSNGLFKLRIRLNDHRYGDHLTLTLFQYVSLLIDLRNFLNKDKQNDTLDEIDDTLRFTLKDINVQKVTIDVDTSYNTPNLFNLSLVRSEGDRVESIVVDKRTVLRLIEYEGEIINTLDGSEDNSSTFLLKSFVMKCAEHLITQKIECNNKTVYTEVKSMYKTSFQSEIFVKFWVLIYTLIEKELEQGSSV